MKINKLSIRKRISKYSKKLKLKDNTTNKIKNKIKNKTQKLYPRNKQYVGSGIKIDWNSPNPKIFQVFSTNDTLEKSYKNFNVKINDQVLPINQTYLKDFNQQFIEDKKKINFIPYRSFTRIYYHLEALVWYELDIFPYHVAMSPKFNHQEELFHSLTNNQYGTLERYFSFFYSPPLNPEKIQKIKIIQRNILFAITYRQLEAIKISLKDSNLQKTLSDIFWKCWKYFISNIESYDNLKILIENLILKLLEDPKINLSYNSSKKKISWKNILIESFKILKEKFSLRDNANIIKENDEKNADPNNKLLSIPDEQLSTINQLRSQHLFSFNTTEINSLCTHQKLLEIIISIRYLFILIEMLSNTDLKKKDDFNKLFSHLNFINYLHRFYLYLKSKLPESPATDSSSAPAMALAPAVDLRPPLVPFLSGGAPPFDKNSEISSPSSFVLTWSSISGKYQYVNTDCLYNSISEFSNSNCQISFSSSLSFPMLNDYQIIIESNQLYYQGEENKLCFDFFKAKLKESGIVFNNNVSYIFGKKEVPIIDFHQGLNQFGLLEIGGMNYLIHLTNDKDTSETLKQRFDRIYESKTSQTGGTGKIDGKEAQATEVEAPGTVEKDILGSRIDQSNELKPTSLSSRFDEVSNQGSSKTINSILTHIKEISDKFYQGEKISYLEYLLIMRSNLYDIIPTDDITLIDQGGNKSKNVTTIKKYNKISQKKIT